MENRSIRHEDRNESALYQRAAEARLTSLAEPGDTSLPEEDLHRLIEFFRLLDRWDRKEVVQ